MQRLESFDCINTDRLAILSYLTDRELDLGEVARFVKKGRSTTFHHLKVLISTNLIAKKKSLKKNWHGKRSHREVQRYQLTPAGKQAVEYFGFEKGVKVND